MGDTAIYTHFTEDVTSSFPGSGSQRLIEKLQNLDVSPAESESIAGEMFTELLLLYEDEKVTADTIAEFLAEAINDDLVAVMFCQALNVFPLTAHLTELISILHRKNVIQARTLAAYLETNTLGAAGIVPGQALTRQLNMKKRDEFYTQKKFNLLHEEFQGFSILVHEFYHILRNTQDSARVPYALRVVESTIGHYYLDPNRVLAVLFDLFSECIVDNYEFMVDFLRQSRWWPEEAAHPEDIANKGGSKSAAKVVALKFLRESSEHIRPEKYMTMAAILIKSGFINFGTLFPYLGPSDPELASLEDQYKKELETEVFRASASALALAAPLAEEEDDDEDLSEKKLSDQPKASTPQTLEEKLKSNSKLQLLKALLTVGVYTPSLFILSKYPFLVHADPEVPKLALRMVEEIINPLYQKSVASDKELMGELQQKGLIPKVFFLDKISYHTAEYPSTRILSPFEKPPNNAKGVFFYEQWADGLPSLETYDELSSLELVRILGVRVADDSAVFSKLCDILLQTYESNVEGRESVFLYFRSFLFPAIGSVEENPVVVQKAYNLMKQFPSEDRFNLYGELHLVLAKNNPHVKITYGRAEKSTKDTLKRLSKENAKQMMRRLSKIIYSNPLPCLLTILQQIESYDNLNTLVVQTAEYFNEYAWDNLTLAILMRLTALGRSNIQEDGLHERQWIQSLASFVGQLCHEYPGKIDLSTILLYILKSFHQNEVSSLLVLSEIISTAGGLKSTTNLTSRQINMINSTFSLQKLVYKTIGDTRHESGESGKVILNAFLHLDALNETFVLLTRLSENIIHGTGYSHLKLLANKNDDIQALMHFFTTSVDFFGDRRLRGILLPIHDLIKKYGVPLAWAFEIWRRYLTDDDKLAENISSCIPEGISSDLFCWFWKLQLYDINFDRALYDTEKEKLTSTIHSMRENLAMARTDRDMTKAKFEEMKDNIVAAEASAKKIPEEVEQHQAHDEAITEKIKQNSLQWWQSLDFAAIRKEVRTFIQTCILPRAIHSSFDAVYSARFIFKLHETRTQNFSAALLIHELFTSQLLFGTLFTCTPTDAENLGMFYAELLKNLNALRDELKYTALVAESFFFANETLQVLTFDEFRTVLFNWHSALLTDVSRSLTVTDYMSRRNAITFLKNLLGVYPTVEDHCEAISSLIENITHKELRQDLILSSSALIGHVKSRAKTWVHMWDFYPMGDEEEAQRKKREALDEEKKQKQAAERRKKEAADQARKAEEDKKRHEAWKAQMEDARKKFEESVAQKKSSIKYDDSASAPSRQQRGTTETVKGRYDNYLKDNKNTDDMDVDSEESKPESNGLKDARKTERNESPAPKRLAPSGRSSTPQGPRSMQQRHRTASPAAEEPTESEDLFKGKPAGKKEQSPEPPKENARTRFLQQQKQKPEPSRATPPARNAPRPPLPPQAPPLQPRATQAPKPQPQRPQGPPRGPQSQLRAPPGPPPRDPPLRLAPHKSDSQRPAPRNDGPLRPPAPRAPSQLRTPQPAGQARSPQNAPSNPPNRNNQNGDKKEERPTSTYNRMAPDNRFRNAAPVPPPLTPPPPPPPPTSRPGNQSFRGRGAKRGSDSYRGRGYDKRQRY